MAYYAIISGANALATLDPSSLSISLNVFTNISYETMIQTFLGAARALFSETFGTMAVTLYVFRRIIGLVERWNSRLVMGALCMGLCAYLGNTYLKASGQKAIATCQERIAATGERIEQLRATTRREEVASQQRIAASQERIAATGERIEQLRATTRREEVASQERIAASQERIAATGERIAATRERIAATRGSIALTRYPGRQ
ncbi:hypothetical protein OQA88_4563 [Cercophora sp. LCS_1]